MCETGCLKFEREAISDAAIGRQDEELAQVTVEVGVQSFLAARLRELFKLAVAVFVYNLVNGPAHD